jgi:hypothetical protein
VYPYDELQGAPAAVRAAHGRILKLVDTGLWKDAQAAIAADRAVLAGDEAARWSAAVLAVIAEGRRRATEGAPYPLLAHLFYGDYAAILRLFEQYTPAQIFAAGGGPLLAGTVAEGYEEELVGQIYEYSFRATDYDPKNGVAMFLRAWAIAVETGEPAAAEFDLEEAVTAMPNVRLFRDALAFVRR